MSDLFELRTERIHPEQKTVLCPFCKKEGKNLSQDQTIQQSSWPATCKHCNETFLIEFTNDTDRDNPLRTLAFAIKELSNSWDGRQVGILEQVKREIRALTAGIKDLQNVTPKPMFTVIRSDKGKVEITPDNNTALRVMDIIDEDNESNIISGDQLFGV